MSSNLAVLQHHSGITLLENGVQPSLAETLRPFKGCNEESFAEFMQAAISEYRNLSQPSAIDRDLISSMIVMCQTLRLLGIAELSPIRRNGLATPEMLKRLEFWLESIESFLSHSLSKNSKSACLSRLISYLCHGSVERPELYAFLTEDLKEIARDKHSELVDEANEILSKFTKAT
ncbi:MULTISPECIES: hypothetical protein [Rhodopirellula]|uniref:Uncharacterized protein n=1 Tax=Rhodopirellula bahusiensis TaxID=2014065 RepID=A0A2G1W2C1_9BACT|nr:MULTISPECIES: hypothetical protein [Rhodopirellula]PHQ33172.1 hypothetical protein CEE69_22185 [Rhodopirellula bahusiensis]|tara:strand:- start:1741 stop:2268 length:528 start_codon:yes stop_codon:yes gene_type:complete